MVKLKCASPSRSCTGLILLVLVVAAPVTGFPADKATVTHKQEASVAAPKPEVETIPSLAEILTAMEVLEAGERRLRQLLADEKRLPVLVAEIDEIEKAFSGAPGLVGNVVKDLAGFHELVDLGTALREADQRLVAASGDLASKAGALDTALDRITAATAKTGIWIKAAEARNAPPALAERIRATIPRHELLARELLARRDQLLEVIGRATRLHGTVSALRDEVSGRRDQLTRGLRTERGEPLWRVESHPGEWGRLMQFLDVQVVQSIRHARDHAVQLLAIAVAAFVLTWWLIVATREPLAEEANTDPHARRVCNLFQVPAAAAIAAALIAVMGFGPQGPFNYLLSLWVLLTLPAVLLVRAVVGPQTSLSLFTLAGAVISQALFGALLDSFPLASRLLLIVQCGALAIALGVDLVHGRFERSFPSLPPTLVRWLATGIIVLLAAAVPATVVGYLGAARVVRNFVFGALGLSLLLSVATGLLYGLTLALMHTRAGRGLRIVRLHRQALCGGLRTGLIVAAFLAFASGMLVMLGLQEQAAWLVDALYHAEITIGSTSIELTGVWAGLAVVLGTIVAVKIAGPLLEVEVLPRLTRQQGLPFAVSTAIRYLLITAGVVLAMAAMGIDLTRVTLLAGALGVGIGFGLQGVVNNFVSGLILLIERPINVGDIVQMGQLRGVVKRIGVRSSTVQTAQGAEVIVPNADLISKEVTNWTLSDRSRCLVIDVGVAYGADPDKVMRLLEAAAGEIAEVLAKPPRSASFAGFGERSLNFRLEAWIDDYSKGGATESALRMAIVRKFREAAIEFPPPQSDPGIRAAPAAPAS